VTKKTLYDRFGAKEQIVVECLAGELGPALMLLHEGALVAHGLNVFADPLTLAREQAEALLRREAHHTSRASRR